MGGRVPNEPRHRRTRALLTEKYDDGPNLAAIDFLAVNDTSGRKSIAIKLAFRKNQGEIVVIVSDAEQ